MVREVHALNKKAVQEACHISHWSRRAIEAKGEDRKRDELLLLHEWCWKFQMHLICVSVWFNGCKCECIFTRWSARIWGKNKYIPSNGVSVLTNHEFGRPIVNRVPLTSRQMSMDYKFNRYTLHWCDCWLENGATKKQQHAFELNQN